MHELTVGPWTLRVAPEATRRAYAALPPTAACRCAECRNLDRALATAGALPAEVVALLAALGAERAVWARRFHVCVLPDELHLYGGWLHVVGEVVAGPDCRLPVGEGQLHELRLEPLGTLAAVGFSRVVQLAPAALVARPLMQVELQLEVPWLLGEPWEDRWASRAATEAG